MVNLTVARQVVFVWTHLYLPAGPWHDQTAHVWQFILMTAMHFLAYRTERPVWVVLVQGNSFKSKFLRRLDAPFAHHACTT